MPDKPTPRKPRRMALYAPFIGLVIVTAIWAVGWSWMRAEVFRRMDDAAAALGQDGYRVDWTDRSLTGFPFRLDLDVTAPRVRETGGWGLAAPRLKAEAFVFAPDHWVIVAPEGATLVRRVGGPARITATALRASISDAGAYPPRLSVEGVGLAFSPGPGAAPVALTAASELHIHTKSGPHDQGAAYLEIDKATPAPGSLLGDIAAGAPVTLIADAIYAPAGVAPGDGLAGALKGFSAAAGQVTVRRFSLQAGAVTAEARSGALGLAADGRLKGAMVVELKQGARLLAAIAAHAHLPPDPVKAAGVVLAAHAQGQASTVTVNFQAGQTTVGPVAVGPSPRVY